jgi:hypothetical protein
MFVSLDSTVIYETTIDSSGKITAFSTPTLNKYFGNNDSIKVIVPDNYMLEIKYGNELINYPAGSYVVNKISNGNPIISINSWHSSRFV